MSEAKERYYMFKIADEVWKNHRPTIIHYSAVDYVNELEQQNKKQESIIADLHELKSEKFVMKKKLLEFEQQKAELISVIKATAELIEKFNLWNELSFEILFSHIENVLNKHKDGE